MKSQLKNLALNPLIIGSFFLFSGGLVANLFNFLFNIFMSRNLRIEDYGTLIALISIVTLLSIPASAVTPTIVSAAGEYFAKKDYSHLKFFYFKMLKVLLLIGVIIVTFLVLLSGILSDFLKIESSLLLFTSVPIILLSYGITVNSSFLQANLSFKFLSLINAISSFFKLAIGLVLVFIGWGLGGAIYGVFASYMVPIIFGVFYLRHVIFYNSTQKVSISFRKLVSYGLPSAIVVFSLTAFVSTDIILAKNLFSEIDAGLYAGLSLVGRVIFYITAPISTVMFPLIVKLKNTNKKYNHILLMSMCLVLISSLAITFFYFLFPEFSILFFLKKTDYLPVAQYIGLFGVFITVYSLLSVISYYYLSIKQTKIWYILLSGVILQGLLIYFLGINFSSLIVISLIITSIMLVILLLNLRLKKSLFL